MVSMLLLKLLNPQHGGTLPHMQPATIEFAAPDKEGTITDLIRFYTARRDVDVVPDDIFLNAMQIKAIDDDSSKNLFAADAQRDENTSAFSHSTFWPSTYKTM